jgi:hypothetical protein
VTCVFCAAWSVPRLYKGANFKERQSQENGNKTEYNRMKIELSVRDSHGKLVVEEKLEVRM